MLRFDAPLPSLPSKKALLWVIAGFFAATFLIYGQSLNHDFVGWDDGMLVYDNPAVRQISPASIKWVFTHFDPELYIPATFLTYQVDYKLGGGSALPFHLGNIILHTLNALLVVGVLNFLTDKKWVALLCGLAFAIHPLHTEAVDWVSARKDVLSTFFFLLSILFYLRWRDNPWGKTLAVSVIFFAIGLMAKVMIVTLPVVLVLLDVAQGRKISKDLVMDKLWYFVPAVFFGLVAILGKTEVLQSSSLTTATLMAFKSQIFYIQKLFWPVDFSVLYPFAGKVTLVSWHFGIPVLVTALLALAAVMFRKRWPELMYGLVFYLLTLVPTFTNIAKGGELDLYFASDRYGYIPSIGLFFAIGMGLWRLLHAQSENIKRGVVGAICIVFVGLSFLSYKQAKVWKNTESLFNNVIRLYPVWSFVAHNNLGNAYRLQGRYEEAITELTQSAEIRPHPKTLSNLGAVYRKLGNYDLAMVQYTKALELSQKSKEAHFGLGLLYAAQDRPDEALREYDTAISLDPRYEEAFSNKGVVLLRLGRNDEALDAFKMAFSTNPFFAEARFNYGNTLMQLGRTDEAIAAFYDNTQVAPAHIPTRINLGLLLYKSGDTDAARRQFKSILQYDPENATAKKALSQMGAL